MKRVLGQDGVNNVQTNDKPNPLNQLQQQAEAFEFAHDYGEFGTL